ncbi:MAG: hypothetical protein H6739_27245 [Alphaproteobacteria bacterium]|nr:hypothetical protein [Alphaproteobacteria bacterium]
MKPLPKGAALAATLALAAIALTALAWAHPGLRLVDFISFSARARRLTEGADLVHPLYPVGYPAALVAVKALVGDALVAGKVISVAAAVGAVGAAARWLGPAAGVWLLGQLALLRWGSTEGTDMAAASLALMSMASASSRRPGLSGALVGAACMMRYTALAAVPVAALLAGRPWRFFGVFALCTAPHWALALATGAPLLPDQTGNLAIAAGEPTALWSWETLGRWPGGFGRALAVSLEDWPTRIAAAGLVVGLVRRDRRAVGLVAFGLAHAALIGLAFANPRLMLPSALCWALGATWLAPRPWLLAAAGLAVGAHSLRADWPLRPDEAQLSAVVDRCATLEGPFLTSSPWFFHRRDGWLEPGGLLRRVPGPPHRLDPPTLARFAREHGVRHVVLDPGRVRATWPALAPLLMGAAVQDTGGLTHVDGVAGWQVWAAPE